MLIFILKQQYKQKVCKMIDNLDLPKVCKMSSLRASIQGTSIVLYQNYLQKKRGIKGYESLPEDELLSALKESERNFDKTKIEENRKKFNDSRHKFSKSRINKIRTEFNEIQNKKDSSASRMKEIKENLLELEKNLSKSKKVL